MRLNIWAAAAAALSVGGCMGGPEDRYEEPFDGPPRPRAQLFISPSGEPFRAPGGEPYPAVVWFAKADADHDGRLSRAEFRADAERWFKTLDADADGQVRMPEVSRWEEDMVPEVTRGAGQFAGGGGPRGDRRGGAAMVSFRREGAAAYSLINEPHPIRGADQDFSMGVHPAEWRRATDRRFLLLDPDGDGQVLPADLQRTPAQGPLEKQRPPGKGR